MDTIQLLRKQIEEMVIPPLPTQAEQDQIMKGRRGQAEIDAGRRAIQDRITAYNQAIAERKQLVSELTKLEGDAQTRSDSHAREKSADPMGNIVLPAAGGAVVGAAYGELTNRGLDRYERGKARALTEISDEIGPTEKLTNSQMNRSRAVGAGKAAERYAPSTAGGKFAGTAGRALAYGIPAGIVLNEFRQYQGRANDETATEADRQANQKVANSLLGVAGGIGVEGGRRFFFQEPAEGTGRALMRIETARDYARRMDANDAARAGDPYTISRGASTAEDVARPDPERMAELRGKRLADLRDEARAANLHTSGTKEDLVRRLSEAPKATGTSVARIANTTMKAALPLSVGYAVYEAMNNPADAAGADPSGVAEYLRERLPAAGTARQAAPSEVGGFVADRIDTASDTLSKVDDVYDDYVRYTQDKGGRPVPRQAFLRQMQGEGYGMVRMAGADRLQAGLKAAEGTSRATAVAAGAGAAGVTAGVMKGAGKLAGYVSDAVSKSPLGRAALRAVPVAGAALTAYDVGNYVAQSATPAPKNDAFAEQYAKTHQPVNPDEIQMERARARQAARMPMESASALEIPNIRPGATAVADRQGAMNSDDFDAQLAAFKQAIEDHNAGIGEAYGP